MATALPCQPIPACSNAQRAAQWLSTQDTHNRSLMLRSQRWELQQQVLTQQKTRRGTGAESAFGARVGVTRDHILFPFEPTYACPDDSFVGTYGDGIKWVCGIRDLVAPCVVYSFGSGPNGQFELAVLAQTPCEVHVFDPTMRSDDTIQAGARMHFHDLGVSGVDGDINLMVPVNDSGRLAKRLLPRPTKTLPSIMKQLGHGFVDILKIDVEGIEAKVFDAAFQRWPKKFPFGQIQMEVHEVRRGQGRSEIYRMMNQIEGRDFHIFHKEANVFHADAFVSFEYAFVRVDKRCTREAGMVHVSHPWAKLLPKDCVS